MFTLTVSTAKSKNIKEEMADSVWIEAMQEELHQFDRLQAKYALEILHKHGVDKGQSIDADHPGCIDSRKSTSGGIQFLGDKLVSWMSKKKNCTAMSSAEAEYVALTASCAQVM
nr:Gag-Pol polyprotein [Tanacetum cinerariifolium]